MTKEYKELEDLPSEQLPNDGGWHWSRLVNEANDRLNKIGKHGKRAKIKVTPKPGKPISAQFSLNGKQQNPGLNLQLNQKNLIKAEEICTLITSQLVADTFTYDWFNSLLGKNKKPIEKEKPLTCGEMLEQYKAHYFKQRKDNKTPNSTWLSCHGHIEKTFLKYKDKSIDLKIVKEVIDQTDNNTTVREKHLNGLANLLRYFNNSNFKTAIKRYKEQNNPKSKDKYIPTDSEIMYIYQTGFEIKPSCPKKWRYRYPKWQFLYALLATYGLRVHEAWNIKNWNKPVYLKAGDYIAIPDDEDSKYEPNNGKYSYRIVQKNDIIYPVLDTINNPHHILCIGHDTKTGYREAFPISPSGAGIECDWIKKFNLIQPINLPDIDDPLKPCSKDNDVKRCTRTISNWFNPRVNISGKRTNKSRFGFSPHSLRHAYNIRGHKLGINQKALANSLGHGLDMNSTTYIKHEQIASKRQGMHLELEKKSRQKTELEQLRDENKYLKTENEKLRTKLAMYEAIEQSKSS